MIFFFRGSGPTPAKAAAESHQGLTAGTAIQEKVLTKKHANRSLAEKGRKEKPVSQCAGNPKTNGWQTPPPPTLKRVFHPPLEGTGYKKQALQVPCARPALTIVSGRPPRGIYLGSHGI